MLLPALGFLLSAAFFAAIGAALLRRGVARPFSPWDLPLFVAAAQLGVLLFAVVYGALFADPQGTLTHPAAIVGMLLGMPLAGIGTGWALLRWRHRH